MPRVKSNWTLTLDPGGSAVVILAAGDFIQDEIDWNGSRVANLANLVRAENAKIRNGKNVSYNFSFVRIQTDDSDTDARVAIMQSLAGPLQKAPAVLKVQIAGVTDKYWQFAEAVVTAVSQRRDTAHQIRKLTRYDVTACNLSEV